MKSFRINTIAFKIQIVKNSSVDFSVDCFVRIQIFSISTSSSFRDMVRSENYATSFVFSNFFSNDFSFVSKDFFRDFRFSSFQISTKMSFSQKQPRIQTFSIQKFRIFQFQIPFSVRTLHSLRTRVQALRLFLSFRDL